ncbi:MAG: hypothetical protein O2894_02630 [Planctomycetota bacterium]|nr:hypothetical protein [Planctomycetota bacterium]
MSSTSNTSNWNNEREDVIVVKGNGAASDPFTSSTETEVTKDIFGGAIKWRFGSLVFTEDNQGLIFWGGASAYTATTTDATSSGYPAAWSVHFLGTYYAYNLSVANQVRGVMPATAGGVGSFPTYSSGSPFAPATPNWTTNMGTIKPYGGFLSRNRDYFYVVNYHPNTSSDQTSLTLLGINIENLSNSSTPSGNVRGRGFKTSGFPARRGFLPSYYYQPHYALSDGYYNPHHTHGGGMQAMHKDTGNVFFMSHYATNGPSNTTGTFGSGPVIPTYWGDYGYRGFHLEGFSADVGGPITRLTHSGLGSDTASRSGQYFTMSADGGKIAYVYQNTATSRTHNQERIGVVTNIGFHPTSGAPNPAMDNGDANKAYEAETSTGRAGESMAFDSGGTKLFYAFKSGAGNENARELVEMTQNPSTGARTFRRVLPARRYNVLYAGR